MRVFALLYWLTAPGVLRRVAPGLAGVLFDGQHLVLVPALGGAAPIVAALLGVLFGATHASDPLFSASLAIIAAIVALGALGGGAGLAFFIGWAVADAVAFPIQPTKEGFAARALVDLAILNGAVVVPAVATALRYRTVKQIPRAWTTTAAAAVVQGFVQAALAYGWAISTPIVLRAYGMWAAYGLSAQEVSPLQDHALAWARLAFGAAVVRVVIEHVAVGRLREEPEIARRLVAFRDIAPRWRAPWPLRAAFRTAFVTFLFSGAIESTTVGALFAGSVFAVLILGRLYAVRVIDRVRPLLAVPVLVRLVVAFVAAYPIVYRIAETGQSYAAVLTAAVVTLIATVVLAPDLFAESNRATR